MPVLIKNQSALARDTYKSFLFIRSKSVRNGTTKDL